MASPFEFQMLELLAASKPMSPTLRIAETGRYVGCGNIIWWNLRARNLSFCDRCHSASNSVAVFVQFRLCEFEAVLTSGPA